MFGGRSAEHEVSLRSAANIIAAMNKEEYLPVPILIDKEGNWTLGEDRVVLVFKDTPRLINFSNPEKETGIDVVFPVLHGPFGEDGTVQGLLKLANLPFVGAGVLGSAVGMDKDVAKRLLKEAGIPIARFLVFNDIDEINFERVVSELDMPFFVKPANLGSSVGVNKVKDENGFEKAISEAFSYDRKILIEEYVKGREIECSVLGNDNPIASVPGEVVVKDEFYSYKAKYIDENGAALEIPAKIDEKTEKKIQNLAIQTFKTLCCEGMGRVDFFLKDNGEVLVNEINTIPGFTSISMYPKLWEKSGLSYTRLIDKLIKLALERFKKEQKLKSSY